MKRLIAVLIISVMLLSLAGCSGSKPDATINKYFSAAQKFDAETMASTIVASNTEEVTETKKLLTEDQTKYFMEYLRSNAAKMTYKVTGSEIEGDKAVVTVDCKYVDGGPLFKATIGAVFSKMLPMAFSGIEFTEEETNQMFLDTMKEQEKIITETYKETTLKINCVKKDNVWYIAETSDEIQDVVLSGLLSATKEIGTAFGGSEGDESKTAESVLNEINNYLIEDLWNDGFNEIDSYFKTGNGSTGQKIDIEFTKSQLDKAMEKKKEYDTYIVGLDSKYSDVQAIWNKLSPEIDSLYKQVKDGVTSIDTGLFNQYRDAFSDSVYDLK